MSFLTSMRMGRRSMPAFYVFSILLALVSTARADESAALYEAGPLNYPVDKLRAWVNEKEVLQPKPAANAVARDGGAAKPPLVRLLAEVRYHFAANGTVRATSWEIVKVKNKEGANSASRVDAVWEPWHKERPTITARVINSDGTVIANDGKDAVEQAVGNSDASVMTDTRQLTLVLHGVEPESIIETKSESVERVESGAWFQRLSMTDITPAKVYRLVITYDNGVQIVHRSLGPELVPQIAEAKETTAKDGSASKGIVFQSDLPLPAMEQMEVGCGPDKSSIPLIEFGMPKSWSELGKVYAQSVEKAIGEGNKFSAALVKSAGDQSKDWDAKQKVIWCDQQIRQALRYTSLAFGEQRIFPVSPDTVFSRRFGDCKDHATLLVAMLREMNVRSHVALLNASVGIDVPREAGAFGLFNHAITYIPEIDQWVDLTAEGYPVGILPLQDQGRRALICDSEGGSLIQTPVMSAAENQSNEIRTFDLNFSGGGHLALSLSCKGIYGLEMRNGYEETAPDKLIESWKGYFKENYGLSELQSFQRSGYAPNSYAIRIASSPAQLLDRQSLEFSSEIDLRNLLSKLPSALQPKQFDKAGQPRDLPHRTHPLVISSGLRATATYSMLYPAALTMSLNAKDWKEKFGPITLSASYQQNDLSNQVGRPRDAQFQWEELVEQPKDAAYNWTSNCDRELRLQFEIVMEPGQLNVEEANRCIDFITKLRGMQSPLVSKIKWNWTALDKFQDGPNTALFKELADQARRYQSFVDPRLAFALELRRFRLDRAAHSIAADIDQVASEHTLALPWLTMLRSTDIHGVQYSPLVDHRAIVELNRDFSIIDRSPVRSVVLQCALSDTKGLHTLNKDSLELAAKFIDSYRSALSNSAMTKEDTAILQNGLTYVLLALHKDEELKQVLRQSTLERFNAIESMLLGKELKVPKTINAKQRSELKRIFWETLINAGRADLADQLHREYWPEPKLPLVAADAQLPKLAALDRTDAESVARHAVLAMLTYEPDRVKEMLIEPEALQFFFAGPNYCPSVLDEWFTRNRSNRSPALIETIVKLTPVVSTPVGEAGMTITFKNPYQKNAFTLWLVKGADEKWTIAPSQPTYIAQQLIAYCDAGNQDQAGKWLEVVMPPLVRDLPWFDNTRGSPAARAWMLREDSRRVELTANLLLAETGKLDPLEKWLKKNTEPLPAHIENFIEQLRIYSSELNGKFGPRLELNLKLAEEAKSFSALHDAVIMAHKLQNYSHEPFDLERINKLVEQVITPKNTDLNSRILQVRVALLSNDHTKAFELLDTILDDKKVDSSTLNTYLWSSMLIKTDPVVLKKRLNKALALQPENAKDDHYYLHTLACAQAICGDPLSAAENLAQIAFTWPDSAQELLRGLILEQLNMPEAAKSAFELCIELEPWSDSAVIAKNRLQNP